MRANGRLESWTRTGTRQIGRFALVVMLTAAGLSADGANARAEDVAITGGTAGFADALGLETTPDAPRFIGEVARLFYATPEGKSPEIDATLQRLRRYIELVREFNAALAEAQPAGRSISLALAPQKNERARLVRLFDFVGLKLNERRNVYSVERTGDLDADHARLLSAIHLNVQQVANRLNAGESVTVDVPAESVPVSLSADLWSRTVFRRKVDGVDLPWAILADRDAALLCRGLAGLDDPTLEYLEQHPAIISHLYDHDANVFGGFSDSLHIRNGQVIVAGGEEAVRLWEDVLGEKTNRPERFIEKLFSDANGRMAFLYSTLDHLDAARRAFALGLSISEPKRRQDAFRALVAEACTDFGDWQLTSAPFRRVPYDLAMLLARVQVTANGASVGPHTRSFWTRAFDADMNVPEKVTPLKELRQGPEIDAAWLARRILVDDAHKRQSYLEQLAFGQRVFAEVHDDSDLSNALIAIRVYPQYPMLMLALERTGTRRSTTFVSTARHAKRLEALDSDHAFVALSQFEGALALLVRLVRVGALDQDGAESLVDALAASVLNEDGWYQGAVAHWIRNPLAASLHLSDTNLDADLVTALAGRKPDRNATVLAFEGEHYRVDLAESERRRLEQLTGKMGRVPLDLIVAVDTMADSLIQRSVNLDVVHTVLAALRMFTLPSARTVGPLNVSMPKPPLQIVDRAIRDLSDITQPKDLKKAANVTDALERLVDDLLADSLRSLVYAIDVGDPERVVGGVDPSARHDFGFASPTHDAAVPWSEARQQVIAGVPWHVRGALLNLDLGLATFALKRVSTQVSRSGTLTDNERETFAQTAATFNPFTVREDEGDLVAASIERGRTRVRALGDAPSIDALHALQKDIGIDGWRLRAVEWTLTHKGDPTPWFSLAELLQAGGAPDPDVVNRWGAIARRTDGCICSRIAVPNQSLLISGRPELGVLATEVPDLGLRVALGLHQLGLPASLARDVLVSETRDFIDLAAPNDTDDWLTLVRAAQGVSDDRIEDYVAALTTGGPLVPAPASEATR